VKEIVSIQLDRDSNTPLYIQLYWHLKNLIKEGVLRHNQKLPSIRKMATELGVNNVTVVNAYRQLEKEGLAYTKIGSGTYIKSEGYNLEEDRDRHQGIDELEMMEQGRLHTMPETINFASITPTPELFPVEHFKMLINRVLDREKGNAFGYHESKGYKPLRQSVCKYLENYSIKTSMENIQIISGAQQGIDVVSKALLEFGDCVFVESPTYRGAIEAFRSRDARIIGISMEEDGINLDELKQKLYTHKPKLVYVMPNFQNPTGYSYSTDKKQKLLQLCEEYNFFVVEDDSFSELNFTQNESLPLKTLDAADRVIYIKSFSKVFMPGLRLGFMVVPRKFWNNIVAAKHTSDISTSGLLQRTFDLYLRDNLWQEHLDFMKGIYKERYNIMVEAVEENFPQEVKFKQTGGGLHLWFQLPEGYSASELYNRCLKKNVLISPDSLFYAEKSPDRYFRMSFAAVYKHQIKQGVQVIGNVLKDYLKEDVSIIHHSEEYSPFL